MPRTFNENLSKYITGTAGPTLLLKSILQIVFGVVLLFVAMAGFVAEPDDSTRSMLLLVFGLPGAVLTIANTLLASLAIGYCIVERSEHLRSHRGTPPEDEL